MAGEIKMSMSVEDVNVSKIVEQTKNSIKTLGNTATETGKVIENSLNRLSLSQLEDRLEKAKMQMSIAMTNLRNFDAGQAGRGVPGFEAANIKSYEEAEHAIKKITEEIRRKTGAEKEAVQQTEQTTGSTVRLRTQLMNAKQAVYELENANKKNTEEYKRAIAELKRLQTATNVINATTKNMASSKGIFLGITSGVSGLSGAFSAAQGAVGLFGAKNEDLQKIMMKVQSAMALTMGLQAIQQTLLSTSAFRIQVVTKVTLLWSKAVQFLNTQLKLSMAASKAFAATGFGAIIVAIGAVIGAIAYFTSKTRKAQQEVKEFNKAVADSAKEPVSSVMLLSKSWEKLGDNINVQQKFILEHKKDFEALGVAINSVKEAEDLLIKNKDKFIEAIIEKGKASAAQKIMEETSGELLMAEYEQQKKHAIKNAIQHPSTASLLLPLPFTYPIVSMYTQQSAKNADKEIEKLKNKSKKMLDAIQAHNERYKQLMKELGVKVPGDFAEGTVGYYDNLIKNEQDKLKDAKTKKEYAEIQKEIERLENERRKITGEKDKKADKEFSNRLKKIKDQYQDYYNWLNSSSEELRSNASKEFSQLIKGGQTYIEHLEKLRGEYAENSKEYKEINNAIADEQTKNQLTQLQEFEERLDAELKLAQTHAEKLKVIEGFGKNLPKEKNPLVEVERKLLEDEKKKIIASQRELSEELLKEYRNYLDKREKALSTFNDKMDALKKQKEGANEKEIAEIDGLIELYEKMYKAGFENFDEIDNINAQNISKLGTFLEKKKQLTEKYNQEIAAAEIAGNEHLQSELQKVMDKELNALAVDAVKGAKAFEKLFSNVEVNSRKSVRKMIKNLETFLEWIIENKDTELKWDNPLFEIDEDAVKQLKKSEDGIKSLKKAVDDLKKNTANDPFTKLGDAMKAFSEEASDENIQSILNAGNSLADNFMSITNSMREIGELTGNENLIVSADLLDDFLGNLQAAQQGAQAWGGWWGAIIGGLTDLIPKLIKWGSGQYRIDNAIAGLEKTIQSYLSEINKFNLLIDDQNYKDYFRERLDEELNNIKEYEEEIKELNRLRDEVEARVRSGNYNGNMGSYVHANDIAFLERYIEEIDKLNNKVTESRDLIELFNEILNAGDGDAQILQQEYLIERYQQIIELRKQQIEDEKTGKEKKWNTELIKEYENDIIDLTAKIKELNEEIKRTFFGSEIKTYAQELGDALLDAFEKGEDAAYAFEKTTKDVIKKIMRNLIMQKLISPAIEKVFNEWWNSLTTTTRRGDIIAPSIDEAIEALPDLQNNLISLVEGLVESLENVPGIKELFGEGSTDTLTGQIKGVTEATASIVAGQLNAIRINQSTYVNLVTQQISILTAIRNNTDYIVRIYEHLTRNNFSVAQVNTPVLMRAYKLS